MVPVILALTLFVWICVGIVYVSGLVLGLISMVIALLGVAVLLTCSLQNGIILDETKESTEETEESKEADENGSHSGGAGGNRPAGPDVPESTEAELETLPAEVLSKPEDEKEAREPEDFYDDLIEEPEGELVQFNDRYRTYQTGDGEYVTVIVDSGSFIEICRHRL